MGETATQASPLHWRILTDEAETILPVPFRAKHQRLIRLANQPLRILGIERINRHAPADGQLTFAARAELRKLRRRNQPLEALEDHLRLLRNPRRWPRLGLA